MFVKNKSQRGGEVVSGEVEYEIRLDIAVSTENATPPKSTKWKVPYLI